MRELLQRLTHAVREDAAIRRIRRCQPTGGVGDKIFPPTYPGNAKQDPPRHVFERRRVDGKDVLCVLIDSVQSQANRLEEALRSARDSGAISFPVITVDFASTDVADIGQITTLDAPHRVFDAIVRDSELKGVRFRDTDHGKRLIQAKAHNARAVFDLSPSALVFGAWNSTGEGGGMGAKFPRAVVSEIIGVGVAMEPDPTGRLPDRPSGQRTGSRIDPLGIRSAVRVYKSSNNDWSFEAPKKAKDAKEVKPSEVNHSNIAPTVTPLGVSVDYALHSFVLSFAALRRLRLAPKAGGASEGDIAAQTALAALGITAALAQDNNGYFLRSRCDLIPEEGAPSGFEIVRADGTKEPFVLNFKDACAMFEGAVKQTEAKDVRWRDKDLVLSPQAKLVQLVKASREKALQGEVEADSEG